MSSEVSDQKTLLEPSQQSLSAKILSQRDYSPFGMQHEGGTGARFGYNGKPLDTRLGGVSGEGVELEIGSRPPTEKGFVPIKNRWVVERTIAWMNLCKEPIRDYTYSTTSRVAWIYPFNIQMGLNRLRVCWL